MTAYDPIIAVPQGRHDPHFPPFIIALISLEVMHVPAALQRLHSWMS